MKQSEIYRKHLVAQVQMFLEKSAQGAEEKGYLKRGEAKTPEGKVLYDLAKAMLIVTEVAEFSEATRRDPNVPDEHCPEYQNRAIELADIIIRTMNLGYEIFGSYAFAEALIAKMEYNDGHRDLKKEGKTI